MKKCNVCQETLEDSAVFCSCCGSTDLSQIPSTQPKQPSVQQPARQSVQQPEQSPIRPVAQQPVQQPVQPIQRPEPQPKPQSVPQPTQQPVQPVKQPEQPSEPHSEQPQPKKSKGSVIVLILSIVMIIVLVLIGVGLFIKNDRTPTTSTTAKTTASTSTTTKPNNHDVSFSEGSYSEDTNTYTNEWANLKLVLGYAWKIASSSQTKQKDTANLISAFYAYCDDGDKMYVAFYKDAKTDGKGYLINLNNNIKKDSSITIYESSEIESVTLAGESYYKLTIYWHKDGKDEYVSLYARKKENYLILLEYNSKDLQEIKDFEEGIVFSVY